MTKKTKIVFFGSMFLFVMSLGTAFGLLYVIEELEQETFSIREKIVKNETQQKDLAALIHLSESIQDEHNALSSYALQNESEVIDFLNLIDSIAFGSNLESKIRSTDIQNIDSSFEELIVEVSVSGLKNNIRHFLSVLDTLPYQSVVSRLSFSETGEEEWSADIALRITKHKEHD